MKINSKDLYISIKSIKKENEESLHLMIKKMNDLYSQTDTEAIELINILNTIESKCMASYGKQGAVCEHIEEELSGPFSIDDSKLMKMIDQLKQDVKFNFENIKYLKSNESSTVEELKKMTDDLKKVLLN